MDIETELIEAAEFAHKVTGCSVKRHLSTRAAVEIKRLRDWIRAEGERSNTCTYNVLGEICGYCECKRKPSNAELWGERSESHTNAVLGAAVPPAPTFDQGEKT